MDTLQDLNSPDPRYRDQVLALSVLTGGYLLFVFSAQEYFALPWYPWLISSRIFMVLISFVSLVAVIRQKNVIENLDAFLFTLGLVFQASHGYLEGPGKVAFTQFVGVLYAISCLTVRIRFSVWVRKIFPFQVFLMAIPILTKNAEFFLSIGKFVDSFSMPITGFLVGTLIARINTLRFEALQRSIELERLLVKEREDRIATISIELEKAKAEIAKSAKDKTMLEVSHQLAHDIRSPLAALDMVLKEVTSLPDDYRVLVHSATTRIRDMANDLITNCKKQNEPVDLVQPQLLQTLISAITTEKRIQFMSRPEIEIGTDFSESSFRLLAKVSGNTLKRVLSNLVNNSVDAMEAGRVVLSLSHKDNYVFVRVCDNGKGIPNEILEKLCVQGASFGKSGTESGSGLGLYHAKQAVESWGGFLTIESEVGRGTIVTIKLPKTPAPVWLCSSIEIKKGETPVVIDDDPSIFHFWYGRFKNLGLKETIHFKESTVFIEWFLRKKEKGEYRYFFDHELIGSKETGLDLIEKLGLSGRSTLITGRHEDQTILKKVKDLGVPLLPKELAAFVPVILAPGIEAATTTDVLLLDANPL